LIDVFIAGLRYLGGFKTAATSYIETLMIHHCLAETASIILRIAWFWL
jgi:hypothetical protein